MTAWSPDALTVNAHYGSPGASVRCAECDLPAHPLQTEHSPGTVSVWIRHILFLLALGIVLSLAARVSRRQCIALYRGEEKSAAKRFFKISIVVAHPPWTMVTLYNVCIGRPLWTMLKQSLTFQLTLSLQCLNPPIAIMQQDYHG